LPFSILPDVIYLIGIVILAHRIKNGFIPLDRDAANQSLSGSNGG
jgi:hypothetical protein